MNARTTGYVTDVPYIPTFIRELAPAWLDHVALMWGIEPPRRGGSFHFCDLGCGQGVTTCILAATHPDGRFHGIDMMPAHVAHARRLAEEAGIGNVAFHVGDFAGGNDAGLPSFDYIVAHGVYSWVGVDAQADLRRFVQRHLKPGGLFYVSYNALPGRAADIPFQRLIHRIGRLGEGDSQSRFQAALEFVDSLADLNVPGLASPMLRHLREQVDSFQSAYLAHEFMNDHWDPLMVTDVRSAMRAIGLVPVGSATLVENFDRFVLGKAARGIVAAISDEDARELARDYLINQCFRRDVFAREPRHIDDDERRRRLFASIFALVQPADSVEYAFAGPAGRVSFDNQVARGIVAALGAGPASLAGLAASRISADQDLLANTLVLCAAGAVRPVEASEAPVQALNKALHRQFGPEAILYLALPCGTALPMKDGLLELFRNGTLGQAHDAWREFLSSHRVAPSHLP